jgi:macrolide transport system ATP-binding/permease protein
VPGISEDLRVAFRSVARNRGFALTAILSLGLGIGANTTIFSLINGLLLRPLPVAQPARLMSLFTLDAHNPGMWLNSYPNYLDYRDRNNVFSSLTLYSTASVSVARNGGAERVMIQLVSANYFPTLGVTPLMGRGFLPEEDRAPGGAAVAVISYSLWTRFFSADPGITSRNITLNRLPYRIVGVAPRGFDGLDALYTAEVWVPFAMYEQLHPFARYVNSRRFLGQSVVGRLRPGVGQAQAAAAMQPLSHDLEQEFPTDNQGRRVTLLPAAQATLNPSTTGPTVARAGIVLLIVSGLVLLVACANVANLLLARAAGRSREIAVRLAVGAGRWLLVRQLLAESALLGLAGGALGLLCAYWTRGLLWSMRPADFRYAAADLPGLDARVFAYTLAVSLLTGLLFGLAPALGSTKSNLATELKERTGQPASAGGAWNLRSLLVIGQVALSVVALVGAGLFTRSVGRASSYDPGFDAARLATIDFNMEDVAYDETRGREFRRLALATAAAVPGVDSASLAQDTFFSVSFQRFVLLGGRDNQSAGRPTLTGLTWPGYFETARIPLLEGRDFRQLDDQASPHVVVVNETAARLFWPNEGALGKSLRFVGDEAPAQVIGVVRTVNYKGIGEVAQPVIYLAMQQFYRPSTVVVIHTAGDPGAAAAAVRRQLQRLEPNLPLDAQSVRTTMANLLWAQRVLADLLGAFGGLALVLAIVGIYGVISYTVTQRAREIGVRLALGATTGDVQRMVLAQGIRLVGLGLTLGLGMALVACRLVESLLPAISARDAATFVLAPLILGLVAMAACLGPAHRAARIDPSTALRSE